VDLEKPDRDPNNTQSELRVGLLVGFVTLRAFKAQHDRAKMDPSDISALIEAGLPGAIVRVQSPDNTHFEALVVADAFDGKRPLQRHQLVYKCLGNLMGNEIHAISIQAHTPDEWRQLESAGQA
jgi:acid stress-induced BolA-like protein IbaG/YrbA